MDVASGMKYLHSKQLIHCDLALRNLLLGLSGDKLIAKIGDFGLSRSLNNNEYYSLNNSQIPVRWTCPEVFVFRKISFESDVWSYGVTCWEIFSEGAVPYHQLSNMQVVEYVTSGKRLEKPEKCPEEFYEIMKQCWFGEASSRPSFESIVKKISKRGSVVDLPEIPASIEPENIGPSFYISA